MTGKSRPSRRTFLGLAGATAGVAGCDAAGRGQGATVAAAVPATGAHQAGIVTPDPPQQNLLTVVYDVDGSPGPLVGELGRTVLALTSGTDPHLAGMSPGDLTVTVGVGPRLVAAVDDALPGATALPAFGKREQLTPAGTGGDLMVQICASNPLLLPGCVAAVAAAGTPGLTERWRQRAFRGPSVTVAPGRYAPRNLLGFVDGIVAPRSPADLAADVWIGSGRVAGGTLAVVRRMEIDLAAFLALAVRAQERVIGRRRGSAAPLSGGTIATDPDLGAKTPTGAYLIPADAHARRANPIATGVPTMLRRSYSMDDETPGLLFVSFQNDLTTFTATLARMTTSDALLAYTTTTRSASFLILPGFATNRPLGATLWPV